jgi:hypothetical protein
VEEEEEEEEEEEDTSNTCKDMAKEDQEQRTRPTYC